MLAKAKENTNRAFNAIRQPQGWKGYVADKAITVALTAAVLNVTPKLIAKVKDLRK